MENNDVCSICLEDLNKNTVKELSCGHKIHFKCFHHNFLTSAFDARNISKNNFTTSFHPQPLTQAIT